MDFIKISGGEITLTFSVEELRMINNALNEVCNAMDADEFATRIGTTMPAALILLEQISQVPAQ